MFKLNTLTASEPPLTFGLLFQVHYAVTRDATPNK